MICLDSAQPHLMLNHFPIVGATITILVWVYTLIRGSKELLLLSYLLSAVVSASTIGAAITGEDAEHAIKKYNRAEINGKAAESSDKDKIVFSPQSLEAMEKHEHAGEAFRNIMIGVLIVSILGIALPKYRTKLMYICIAILLTSLYFAFDAGHTGGMIRHPEIR